MHGNFIGFLFHLPLVIQAGCLLLLIFTLVCGFRLHWITYKLLKQIKVLRNCLEDQREGETDRTRRISEEEWGEIRGRCRISLQMPVPGGAVSAVPLNYILE